MNILQLLQIAMVGIILTISPAILKASAATPDTCPASDASLPPELHDVVTKAEALAADGNYTRAINHLSSWLKTHSDTDDAYPQYLLGYFQHRTGNNSAALAPLQKAVTHNPCFVEAWQLLAAVRQALTQYDQAAQALSRAAALADDPDLHYQTAVLWLQDHQPQAAIAVLEPLLEGRNVPADRWLALAQARQQLQQPERAAEALMQAARISGDTEHQYQAALLWLEAGQPPRALPLLKQLTDTASPRTEWLVALSQTLQALQEKEATAAAMEKAARQSNRADLLFQAAWLWLEASRPQSALPLLQLLAQRKQPQTEWLLALCNTFIMLNGFAEAAAVMERVIERHPEPTYLYNGGILWLQAEKPRRALPHLLQLSRLPDPQADWFVALGHAHIQTDNIPLAAEAMERAAQISGKPEHAFQAGVLRVQLKEADAALKLLQPLARLPQPEAAWLVALANAWVLKEAYTGAARAMEQAGGISRQPDHFFRAAQLWLQDEQPRQARPLLLKLAERATPEGAWLVTLSHTHLLLEELAAAAAAMERAADITRQGDHYYRAAMLWRQVDHTAKTLNLLEMAVNREPGRTDWRIELATLLLDLERTADARRVLTDANLLAAGLSTDWRYRGARLWLNLDQPKQALPVLEYLCAVPDPQYDWLVSLVRTQVELEHLRPAEKSLLQLLTRYAARPEAWELAVWMALQQADYIRAAAAMEVVARLKPEHVVHRTTLGRLYQMAGVPVKAVREMMATWDSQPQADNWDAVVRIYLSTGRHDLALEPARHAADAEPTADRWETVGDIAAHLYRLEDSYAAYQQALELESVLKSVLKSVLEPVLKSELKPELELAKAGQIHLKAGNILLRLGRYEPATRHFEAALQQSERNSATAHSAWYHLAYIRQIEAFFNN